MNIKPGTYPAIASGYETVFYIGNIEYRATCETGVRGIGCVDAVTIGETEDESKSFLLGKIVSLKFEETIPHLPSGSYDAVASGGTTRFTVEGVTWIGYTNDRFVKGVDVQDTVRIDPGEITSQILGDIGSVEIAND